MEAIAFLLWLSYIEGLPTERDRALFGICLYTTARINEACSLHAADVYTADGRVRDRLPSDELRLGESRRRDRFPCHQS